MCWPFNPYWCIAAAESLVHLSSVLVNTVAFHFLTPAPNVYNNSPTSDPLVPCIEPDADSNPRICPGNGLLEDMDFGSADLNTSKVFAWNREVSIAFTFAATQVNQVNLFFYNIPSSGVGLPPAELYWSDTNAALPTTAGGTTRHSACYPGPVIPVWSAAEHKYGSYLSSLSDVCSSSSFHLFSASHPSSGLTTAATVSGHHTRHLSTIIILILHMI